MKKRRIILAMVFVIALIVAMSSTALASYKTYSSGGFSYSFLSTSIATKSATQQAHDDNFYFIKISDGDTYSYQSQICYTGGGANTAYKSVFSGRETYFDTSLTSFKIRIKNYQWWGQECKISGRFGR